MGRLVYPVVRRLSPRTFCFLAPRVLLRTLLTEFYHQLPGLPFWINSEWLVSFTAERLWPNVGFDASPDPAERIQPHAGRGEVRSFDRPKVAPQRNLNFTEFRFGQN